jgi:hypothetical protein
MLVIKIIAYSALFLSGLALISLYLSRHNWHKPEAVLTGFFFSSLICICFVLVTNDSPVVLICMIPVLLVLLIVLRMDILAPPRTSTGDPITDEEFVYREKPEIKEIIDQKACPYCGLEVLVTDKTCCHCGHDLTEAPETAYAKASSIESANQADIIFDIDNPGLAADPDPVSVDEADRRASLWVAGTLIVMSALAGLIYLATR